MKTLGTNLFSPDVWHQEEFLQCRRNTACWAVAQHGLPAPSSGQPGQAEQTFNRRRRASSHHCLVLPSTGFLSRPLPSPCPCPCCSCWWSQGWRWQRWWAMGWLRLPRAPPPPCFASPAACRPSAEGGPGPRSTADKIQGRPGVRV